MVKKGCLKVILVAYYTLATLSGDTRIINLFLSILSLNTRTTVLFISFTSWHKIPGQIINR